MPFAPLPTEKELLVLQLQLLAGGGQRGPGKTGRQPICRGARYQERRLHLCGQGLFGPLGALSAPTSALWLTRTHSYQAYLRERLVY